MYYQSAPERANAAEKARMESYEKCRHIPISTPRKYSFDFISKTFDHKEVNNDIGKVIISYKKYFPVDYSSAVFLVCANADKMNAGYPINYRVTQVMMICRLVHVTSQRYKVLEKGGWLRHTLDLSLAPDRPLRGRSVRSPQIQGVSEPTPLF